MFSLVAFPVVLRCQSSLFLAGFDDEEGHSLRRLSVRASLYAPSTSGEIMLGSSDNLSILGMSVLPTPCNSCVALKLPTVLATRCGCGRALG